MKRIGILRGGDAEYYNTSLKKGGEVILHLHENLADKYKPVDILIDREYMWYVNGLPINPSELVNKIDIAWNFSHPSVSNILESLAIPHIRNVSLFGNGQHQGRELLREHMKKIGVPMPRQVISPKNAQEVFEKFGSPWIVKIYNEVKIAKTFPELAEMINEKVGVIVEEFIPGKIASVHSVPAFRGQDVYVFPVGDVFSNFSREEKERLVSLAKSLHAHIEARHYLKSDFVLNPRGRVYLLNIESHPDIKPGSHFHQVCESVGAKVHQVIDHLLERVK